jgi:dTMP kinase
VGRLIAVEGLDGVGKTTLSRSLAEALNTEWRTTPNAALRELRDRIEAAYRGAAHGRALFYASTVMALSEQSRVSLEQGRDLIVDRYWLSTWAYSRLLSPRLELGPIEDAIRPADVTIFLEASDPIRRARLTMRGASALDRSTLRRDNARRLRDAYEEGLTRAVAGRVVRIDTSALPEDGVLTAALDAVVATSSTTAGVAR